MKKCRLTISDIAQSLNELSPLAEITFVPLLNHADDFFAQKVLGNVGLVYHLGIQPNKGNAMYNMKERFCVRYLMNSHARYRDDTLNCRAQGDATRIDETFDIFKYLVLPLVDIFENDRSRLDTASDIQFIQEESNFENDALVVDVIFEQLFFHEYFAREEEPITRIKFNIKEDKHEF